MVSVSLSLTLVEITKLNTINEKRPSLMKPLEEKKPLLWSVVVYLYLMKLFILQYCIKAIRVVLY